MKSKWLEFEFEQQRINGPIKLKGLIRIDDISSIVQTPNETILVTMVGGKVITLQMSYSDVLSKIL